MAPSFTGAVLTGGASRRMGPGIDKALLRLPGDDRPLARRTADVLAAAGAAEVLAVGGDRRALEALGLAWTPDRYPGQGPLGGIVSALDAARHDLVVVLATDLADVDAATVTAVLDAVIVTADVDVALATTDRLEPLCGAWRRRAAPALEHAHARGERAVHAALGELRVARVVVPAAALRNLNRPSDL